MRAVFGDTSYFLALLIPTDAWHRSAAEWSRTYFDTVVTTDYVTLEVGNYLSAGPKRHLFGTFLELIEKSGQIKVISASSDWMRRGCAFYLERPDKEWSLTDCISFCVMQERGISEAATADRHFEQAGFRVLLEKG